MWSKSTLDPRIKLRVWKRNLLGLGKLRKSIVSIYYHGWMWVDSCEIMVSKCNYFNYVFSHDLHVWPRVQRTTTRLIPQFRKLSYEERLQKLGLTTLKERRQRGDMIEVFKLLAGVENTDCNQFFTSAPTCYALRGHDRKLVKKRSRLDTRKFVQNRPKNWTPNSCSYLQQTLMDFTVSFTVGPRIILQFKDLWHIS